MTFKKKWCLFFIIISILLTVPKLAYSRWAEYQDIGIEYDFYNRNVEIDKNGAYSETVEFQIKILKDFAKDFWTHYTLLYDASNTELTIIKAKTIYKNITYDVYEEFIEDKPLYSSSLGFDQFHQILIAFPMVELNSKLYLKYTIKNLYPTTNGWFYTHFVYGVDGLWKNSKVNVKSKIPFHIEVNDPEKILKIENSITKENQNLSIVLIKPVMKIVTDDLYYEINPKLFPWCAVSTINDVKIYIQSLLNEWTKILNQTPPNLYLDIIAKAKKIKSPIEQINFVTSTLTNKIRYMGDWRTIEGKYIPRSLTEVANSRLGDCKDFAAATTIILNKLGFDATVALVFRGERHYSGPTNIDKLYDFNHAIVRVVANGKILWIDPTNIVSMADSIFPDIAARSTLVLDYKNPRQEYIPSIDYKHSQYIHEQVWDLKQEDKFKLYGKFILKGEQVIPFIENITNLSTLSQTNAILNEIVDVSQIINSKVTLPKVNIKNVQDIYADYEILLKNNENLTSAGIAFTIFASPIINKFIIIPEQVTDLYIGPPKTIKTKLTIKNINPINIKSIDCVIKSPWLDFSRIFIFEKNQVAMEENIEIKRSWVYNEDLKTLPYKELINKLHKYVIEPPSIIYTRNQNNGKNNIINK